MNDSIATFAASISIALSWRQFQSQQAQARFDSIGNHGEYRPPEENEFAPSNPPNTQISGVPTACASTVVKQGEQ